MKTKENGESREKMESVTGILTIRRKGSVFVVLQKYVEMRTINTSNLP